MSFCRIDFHLFSCRLSSAEFRMRGRRVRRQSFASGRVPSGRVHPGGRRGVAVGLYDAVSCAVWLSGTCVLPASSPTYVFSVHTALRGGFGGTESSPDERLPGSRSAQASALVMSAAPSSV